MKISRSCNPKQYKAYTNRNIQEISQFKSLSEDVLSAIRVVSRVLPFRANNYVIDELIDWNNIPDDPIFQLVFPQPGMLEPADFEAVRQQVDQKASDHVIGQVVTGIQDKMNPHPAGQMQMNVPVQKGKPLSGMQHKYNETVLFFPTQGQTCHAYCTYCFRWAQFVGHEDLKFASKNVDELMRYLDSHPQVTDVLITGGDPLIMSSKILRRFVEPLIQNKPGNIRTIRFGTKVPAYWPYRFLTDRDSDDLIRLFDEVIDSDLHLAIMAHFSHYRELQTDAVASAMKRITETGAMIRCQAPLIRHINDDPHVWATMWNYQVNYGATPYYMFVERDTGPKNYFSVPLAEAYDIFTNAYSRVSGLCRTVRGPSMSATPGKIQVEGISEIAGEKVFVLKFIQGRDPSWVNKIFYAHYDEKARWITELKPAFGESSFFYEDRLNEIRKGK
ncbi:MAG: 4Fe-4S cluster-binding domain-containing protein [Proteobacteria bacterium]|nr:4Fe-4S cluster-binding domain-containing protein [Pseudomonadota bacterium]